MIDKHKKPNSFVYIWQYNVNKANKINSDILKNPLLESHLHIIQNKGYLYYIGIHEGSNIRYAHSSDTVLALGLPKEVDYDNLPTGWKRRKIFIGETYKQVQDKESKLLKIAHDDHNWDNYLNKSYWTGGHLFGGAGKTHPKYEHGKRGGENRFDSEVMNTYFKELYHEKMKDPEYKKKYNARKKRELLARKKRQIEEATPSFDKSILRYLYESETEYLLKENITKKPL